MQNEKILAYCSYIKMLDEHEQRQIAIAPAAVPTCVATTTKATRGPRISEYFPTTAAATAIFVSSISGSQCYRDYFSCHRTYR